MNIERGIETMKNRIMYIRIYNDPEVVNITRADIKLTDHTEYNFLNWSLKEQREKILRQIEDFTIIYDERIKKPFNDV